MAYSLNIFKAYNLLWSYIKMYRMPTLCHTVQIYADRNARELRSSGINNLLFSEKEAKH